MRRPDARNAAVPRRVRAGCRAGFTLIELLVVVAIISLLIAILIPALARARDMARRSKCAAGLHDIGNAFQMYFDDSAGRMLQGVQANAMYGGRQGAPPSLGILQTDPPNPAFERPLNPYLHYPKITWDAPLFRCPSDTGGDTHDPTSYDIAGTSYQTNPFVIGQNIIGFHPRNPCRVAITHVNERRAGPAGSAGRPITLTDIDVSHSEVVLAGDWFWYQDALFNLDFKYWWHRVPMTHNLAFMDGHVQFQRITKGLYVGEGYSINPHTMFRGEFADQQIPVQFP